VGLDLPELLWLNQKIKMNLLPKINNWILVLSLLLFSFLGYRAIETGKCIEADFKSIKVGVCSD
jgi:hypothetical protein